MVKLLPCGFGESKMHRNASGFMGCRTGTPNVVPVSSAFNSDEFAAPELCRASQTDRCGGLAKLGSDLEASQSSCWLFALPSLCLSPGRYEGKYPIIIQENPLTVFGGCFIAYSRVAQMGRMELGSRSSDFWCVYVHGLQKITWTKKMKSCILLLRVFK